MERKEWILYFITIILSLTLFFVIILFLQEKQYYSLLWISYITLALIIIGIIKRNANLILSQLIIILIPDTIWTIYFIISIIDRSRLAVPTIFFNVANFLQGILSLLHIYVIIFAFIALAIIKVKNDYKILLISFSEIIIVFLLMILIPGNNGINCMPTPVNCAAITLPNFIPYPLFLIFSASLFILISYFVIISIPVFMKKD